PDALKVGRLRAGTRAGDEQIATELKVQSDKRGIRRCQKSFDALVRWLGSSAVGTEGETDTVKKPAMIADMAIPQCCEGEFGSRGELTGGALIHFVLRSVGLLVVAPVSGSGGED